MGKKTYNTLYNPEWENPEFYPDLAEWIQPCKTGQADDKNHFQCKFCKSGRLKLSTMGVQGPLSHQKNAANKDGSIRVTSTTNA